MDFVTQRTVRYSSNGFLRLHQPQLTVNEFRSIVMSLPFCGLICFVLAYYEEILFLKDLSNLKRNYFSRTNLKSSDNEH